MCVGGKHERPNRTARHPNLAHDNFPAALRIDGCAPQMVYIVVQGLKGDSVNTMVAWSLCLLFEEMQRWHRKSLVIKVERDT